MILSCPYNFLLSGPQSLLAAIAGDCAGSLARKRSKIKAPRLPTAPSDRLGCRPRVKPASGCSQRRKGDLRDNVATPMM